MNNIRNIGIVAHVDAGKTTTTERILFYSGASHKIGEVHDGNTTTDWMKQEQERGITITSASVTIYWNTEFFNSVINLIDTPGHVDFTIEVERSLRVLDGVVILVCAASGIQPQTETVWNQSLKFKIPKIIFVNKMDRQGANYLSVINSIEKRFKCNIIILTINIGEENNFNQIIDLIDCIEYCWNNENFIKKKIDVKNLKIYNFYREKLLETLSNNDDIFFDKYLNNNFDKKDIIYSIRKCVYMNKLIPICCGSSLKNKGIEILLNSIVNFLPEPNNIIKINNNEIALKNIFLALLFKIQNDSYLGSLSFIRIYSGSVQPGQFLYNLSKKKKEKVFRILRMFANNKKDLNFAYSGDIVVLIGLKESFTGDTLSDNENGFILEKINIPNPVISISIEPIHKNDQEKLINLLTKISKEDPSLLVNINSLTGETIISGMGELHIEIIVDRINNEFNIKTKTSKPQVSYKESIKKKVNAEGKYIKQSGGRGQYGHVVLSIEPINNDLIDENLIEFNIIGGVIPKEYFLPIEKGLKEQLKTGIISGYPVIKTKVLVINGSFHSVDSSEYAFRNAASIALKNALRISNSFLLEPIMKVEIIVPEEYLGIIISEIGKKRGIVNTVLDYNNNFKNINCSIPLKELFGFSTELRSNTKGRATYNMEFFKYLEIPKHCVEQIKK